MVFDLALHAMISTLQVKWYVPFQAGRSESWCSNMNNNNYDQAIDSAPLFKAIDNMSAYEYSDAAIHI